MDPAEASATADQISLYTAHSVPSPEQRVPPSPNIGDNFGGGGGGGAAAGHNAVAALRTEGAAPSTSAAAFGAAPLPSAAAVPGSGDSSPAAACAHATANLPPPQLVKGMKISVYFDSDDAWFRGEVISTESAVYNESDGYVKVRYSDGEVLSHLLFADSWSWKVVEHDRTTADGANEEEHEPREGGSRIHTHNRNHHGRTHSRTHNRSRNRNRNVAPSPFEVQADECIVTRTSYNALVKATPAGGAGAAEASFTMDAADYIVPAVTPTSLPISTTPSPSQFVDALPSVSLLLPLASISEPSPPPKEGGGSSLLLPPQQQQQQQQQTATARPFLLESTLGSQAGTPQETETTVARVTAAADYVSSYAKPSRARKKVSRLLNEKPGPQLATSDRLSSGNSSSSSIGKPKVANNTKVKTKVTTPSTTPRSVAGSPCVPTCTGCGNTFTSDYSLRRHTEKHCKSAAKDAAVATEGEEDDNVAHALNSIEPTPPPTLEPAGNGGKKTPAAGSTATSASNGGSGRRRRKEKLELLPSPQPKQVQRMTQSYNELPCGTPYCTLTTNHLGNHTDSRDEAVQISSKVRKEALNKEPEATVSRVITAADYVSNYVKPSRARTKVNRLLNEKSGPQSATTAKLAHKSASLSPSSAQSPPFCSTTAVAHNAPDQHDLPSSIVASSPPSISLSSLAMARQQKEEHGNQGIKKRRTSLQNSGTNVNALSIAAKSAASNQTCKCHKTKCSACKNCIAKHCTCKSSASSLSPAAKPTPPSSVVSPGIQVKPKPKGTPTSTPPPATPRSSSLSPQVPTCTGCGNTFTSDYNLRRHTEKHCKSAAKDAAVATEGEEDGNVAQALNSTERTPPQTLDRAVTAKEKAGPALALKKKARIACSECSETFRKQSDLKKHMAKKHTPYCICRKGERGNMLACATCKEWFHFDCVHLPAKFAPSKSDPWFCFKCQPTSSASSLPLQPTPAATSAFVPGQNLSTKPDPEASCRMDSGKEEAATMVAAARVVGDRADIPASAAADAAAADAAGSPGKSSKTATTAAATTVEPDPASPLVFSYEWKKASDPKIELKPGMEISVYFETNDAYFRGTVLRTTRNLPCDKCDETFEKEKDLDKHYASKHTAQRRVQPGVHTSTLTHAQHGNVVYESQNGAWITVKVKASGELVKVRRSTLVGDLDNIIQSATADDDPIEDSNVDSDNEELTADDGYVSIKYANDGQVIDKVLYKDEWQVQRHTQST